MPNYDFSIEDHGSIFIFTPETDTAREWWESRVDGGSTFGQGYAVEYRFINHIVHAILAEGLTITKDDKTMQICEATGDLILV